MLPGTPMPLHIFEERYQEMIGTCIAQNSEFGIVQAGERGILNIGCTATVDKVVERYEDGRMDIVVRGQRRFEVLGIDEQRSYLRAEVRYFNDEDAEPAPKDQRARALAGLAALRVAEESTDVVLPDPRDPQLSFRVAWFIADLALRQTLLTIRSETDRLRHLNAFLPEHIAKVKRRTHVMKVAPKNGHGMIRIGEA